MKILLSTRNPSKAEQIQDMFAGLPIEIVTLSQAGIEGEALEDGTTLQDNALNKALFAHWKSGNGWTMADDTGLFIDALNGEPGVRAARWAGETATTDEITQFTLRKLEGIKHRSATFETAVVVITPSGERHFFSGRVRGQLMESARVKPQPKMPYSCLFVPSGENQVWAEMTTEHENRISHRGKAFRLVRAFLEKKLVV